jgi:hypothetical protein
MTKRSCGDFFVISRKWLGVFLEIFRKSGGIFLKIHGLQLDYKEVKEPLCKFLGIIDFWIYFSMENQGGLSPWLMDQCRAQSTVDRPPWLATKLDGARLSGRSGARWLARGGATGRGVYGESISGLTKARATVWRPSDGGEEMAEEALGAGCAWARREQ